MIHLQPNVASNRVYVTPFEARKFMGKFTHYLMVLKNNATEQEYPLVMNVSVDNERYTQTVIATNNDSPTNGRIALKESGLYTYTIYGQTNGTNLDPTDAVVVGVCEVGACKVSDEAAWTIPTVTIPDNVIYYE